MNQNYKEINFEDYIEKLLTGQIGQVSQTGQVNESQTNYGTQAPKYITSHRSSYDADFAMDVDLLLKFLEASQPQVMAEIKKMHDWQNTLKKRLDKMIKKRGIIHVLQNGIKIDQHTLILLYEVPIASSPDTSRANFQKNIFSIMRQVPYHRTNQKQDIDIVLFVNGMPIVTAELKNPPTGQDIQDAIHQYKNEREPREPLLQFGRCLVHFAVDHNEVMMCTRLNGPESFFLPFNKGHEFGKGNPNNPNGYKTDYLWEVLQPTSLTKIIQHFVILEQKNKSASKLEKGDTLIFPRYHQLDVVRMLLHSSHNLGVGRTYLIQHSAGSGKSYSITWLAYQLLDVYPQNIQLPGAKKLDMPLFNTVIIVTDRKLLDQQISNTIRKFAKTEIFARADSAKELRALIAEGKRIISTTLQKFPHITEGIADIKDKTFAIIMDEAHSSQTGDAASAMYSKLGNILDEEEDKEKSDEEKNFDDVVLQAIRAKKLIANASFFAFTATPKRATFERFGDRTGDVDDPSLHATHTYSMKQAIEEGFIIDVLHNYTTYRSYYEIVKRITEEDKRFDNARAQSRIKAHVEKDKQTIDAKAEVMLAHFLEKVFKNPHTLKGQGKAMVVTRGINHAINYYLAIQKILQDKGNPFKILIAFSEEKTLDGKTYTEANMNNVPDIKKAFEEDEYRILVVANKFLTGFDQPKLCAMYIDKKLSGVLAVQALGRLNRAANKLNKTKERVFVLDFFNEAEDIKEAFDPYFTSTSLANPTDPNILHDFKEFLDEARVYTQQEVDDFAKLYINNATADKWTPILDVVAGKFKNLSDDEKILFKMRAKQFVKTYANIYAIISFEVVDWEKLFCFLKELIPKLVLNIQEDNDLDDILQSIDLSTYLLERRSENEGISLDGDHTSLEAGTERARGLANPAEKEHIDVIVQTFNERWFGQDMTAEEFKEKVVKIINYIKSDPNYESNIVNNNDKEQQSDLIKELVEKALREDRKQSLDIYKLFQNPDSDFSPHLLEIISKYLDL